MFLTIQVLLFKSLDDEASPAPRDGVPRATPAGSRGVVKVPSLLFDIEVKQLMRFFAVSVTRKGQCA